MDALSEILSGVKPNGAVFFNAEFSAPWALTVPESNVTAATLRLAPAHLVLYHFVIDGGAVVDLVDGPTMELEPGDVVVFPHGNPHSMSCGNGATRPFPNYGITEKIKLSRWRLSTSCAIT